MDFKDSFTTIISLCALGISLFSLYNSLRQFKLATKTFADAHEWNRRNFASQMISNWNKQTKLVIDDIEKIEPGIIDFGKDNNLTQITQKDAESIYFSRYSEDSREWKLRTRFIHLLNEFESIAAAHKNAVGDRDMIEESFRDIFVKWGFVLLHFINIYKVQRGNETPWGPYHSLYETWCSKYPKSLRRQTGFPHEWQRPI